MVSIVNSVALWYNQVDTCQGESRSHPTLISSSIILRASQKVHTAAIKTAQAATATNAKTVKASLISSWSSSEAPSARILFSKVAVLGALAKV
jgi:hypothetical protein